MSENDEPESPSSDPDTYASMLDRGILPSEHRAVADKIFGQENFTLLVLHVHLLIEKALNEQLKQHGFPAVTLGPDCLEFSQKVQAFFELRGQNPRKPSLFTVLNTLRNNVAHDFWNEAAWSVTHSRDSCRRRSTK